MKRATHQVVAGIGVATYLANGSGRAGAYPVDPMLGGVAAALFTNLPDLLEPATSPNHRAFFHSIAFAALLGAGFFQTKPMAGRDRFRTVLEERSHVGGLGLPDSSGTGLYDGEVAAVGWSKNLSDA